MDKKNCYSRVQTDDSEELNSVVSNLYSLQFFILVTWKMPFFLLSERSAPLLKTTELCKFLGNSCNGVPSSRDWGTLNVLATTANGLKRRFWKFY